MCSDLPLRAKRGVLSTSRPIEQFEDEESVLVPSGNRLESEGDFRGTEIRSRIEGHSFLASSLSPIVHTMSVVILAILPSVPKAVTMSRRHDFDIFQKVQRILM